MTVALVGSTGWSGVKTWPAGSAAGHVAVLVGAPTLGWGTPSVPGWSFLGWSWAESGFLFLRVGSPVWARTLSAADVAAAPPDLLGQVAVFSGTPRVASAMSGGSVTVPANGAAVAVVASYNAISGGTVTWLTEYAGSARARVGWKAAGGSEETVSVPSTARPLMIALAGPAAPLSPLIVSPVSVEVSSSDPAGFVWVHQPTIQGGSQSHYALAVTTSTYGTRWWTGSAWAGSETWVAGSVGGVSVPAASLVADQPHSWTVRTRELLDGRDSPPSAAGVFTPVTPPSMTLTGPVSPVVDDLSPTVTWSRVTPRGSQTAFRVWWLTPAGEVVADSGVVQSSAASWTAPPTTAWERGVTYTVRGQVWQTGGSVSPVQSATVVVDWTPPATPVVTATPEEMGVAVIVSGIVTGSPVMLQRLLASGDWVDVLNVAAATAGSLRVVDVFAEYDTVVRWRARQSSTLEGVGMVSDWGESFPVVSMDMGAYVADAADPLQTWQRVRVRSQSTRVEHQNRYVAWGVGDSHATVWSDPAQGDTGGAVFYAGSAAEVQVLRDLLSRARTLMLRDNTEAEGAGWVQPPTRWVALTGQFTPDRVQDSPVGGRFVSVQWVEQPVTVLGSTVAPVTSPVLWA